ncbi:MFS general substrate transporter [Piedraia hortae CBS 480.64]|uniref:MFS general substrate transporter n=1 Tax=Piedraia hortae CBS 480.64 TaxID=1314780 RepID=A0A6A7C8N4_9PEZI|nr:MFS general substrate transporter [Piedraia hortae CBS 480.64]
MSTDGEKQPKIKRLWRTMLWTPPNVRWDASKPPKFSLALNILFGLAGAFTVANLYYNHPILNILARDFNVDYREVANIPTLAQAGYAVGLLLLCPLGDMVQRRPFVLALVFCTSCLSIGLCLTSSVVVFQVIQFLTAVTTVTPQLMLPLVGDLAPPKRRATAMSIVVSSLAMGILLARLLSGVMTQYTSWRNVYWLSTGLQYSIFIGLWLFMPDYPATNERSNYLKLLWSIVVMFTKHPVLVQGCLTSFFISATFTNFWTTVTFLLAGSPYHFDPVKIGLMSLTGVGTMTCIPIYARFFIDRYVPALSILLGVFYALIGVSIGTYTGTITLAGPIIQAMLNDFGMQSTQIANRNAIFAVEPKGRNRLNTAIMISTFLGQLTGTSVGAALFSNDGWIASGSFSMGCLGMAFLVNIVRGPWEEGWLGWSGGWSFKKKSRDSATGKVEETQPDPLGLNAKEKNEGGEA